MNPNVPPANDSPAKSLGVLPLVAALLTLPAIAYVVGLVAMPHPQSVEVSRTTLDRNKLATGQVLLTQAPTPKMPNSASFGGKITVLGLDSESTTANLGQRVPLTFYFRCDGEMQESWKVFLHVDSQAGQYRIHGDHFPPEGYGTERWRKGDMVADRYTLWVPLDAHKGNYDIWMGFYDPAHEDDRLTLAPGPGYQADSTNRLKLGTFTVN